MPKKHLYGGKIQGRHTTVIDACRRLLERLCRLAHVTKITLGNITVKRRSSGLIHAKIDPIKGGWKLTVSSSNEVQIAFIYTKNESEFLMDFIKVKEDLSIA